MKFHLDRLYSEKIVIPKNNSSFLAYSKKSVTKQASYQTKQPGIGIRASGNIKNLNATSVESAQCIVMYSEEI